MWPIIILHKITCLWLSQQSCCLRVWAKVYKIIKGEVRFLFIFIYLFYLFLFILFFNFNFLFIYFFKLQQVLEPRYQPYFMRHKLDKTAGMLHKIS